MISTISQQAAISLQGVASSAARTWFPRAGRLWLLISVLFLSACTSLGQKQPPENTEIDPDIHRQQIAAIDTWEFNGKLGFRTPADSGSAYLNWRQSGENYTIRLQGPFGQGNLSISGDDSKATLTTPGQEPYTAASAEDLLYETLGWSLPVSQLRYWIRGIAAPDSDQENYQYDDRGLLESISQNSWDITYSSYQSTDLTYLPEKLKASNQDATLTVIIKQWQFPTLSN